MEKAKILIVEDDRASYFLLEEVLSEFPFEILHAGNGKKAVELVEEHQNIDLILMDLKLPVMDGIEATQRIRKINSDIVVIAQTAHAMAGDRELALENGCDEYISKPIDYKKIIDLVMHYTR